MGKRSFILTVLIAIGLTIGVIHGHNNKKFYILNTYKVSSDNFQSVTLQVVVNKWNYDEEEMLSVVKEFYYENNGKPDKLTIAFYDSKNDFEKSKCRICKSF